MGSGSGDRSGFSTTAQPPSLRSTPRTWPSAPSPPSPRAAQRLVSKGAPSPLEGDPLGLHVGGALPPPPRLLGCTAGRWGTGRRAEPGL